MSRLSWFPFYVDDFMGGTTTLSGSECGRYLLCLAAQWASAERGAISAAPDKLRAICRGEDPGPDVLEKFERIDINGQPFLRNARLWKEWLKAKSEYDGRRRGADRTNERAAQEDAERTTTHNPQPTTDNTDGPSARSSGEQDHRERMLDHSRQQYAEEVWQAFCAKAGHPATRVMGPNEYLHVQRWMDADVPVRVVLTAIRETKGVGSTLGYYAPSVFEEFKRVKRARGVA